MATQLSVVRSAAPDPALVSRLSTLVAQASVASPAEIRALVDNDFEAYYSE